MYLFNVLLIFGANLVVIEGVREVLSTYFGKIENVAKRDQGLGGIGLPAAWVVRGEDDEGAPGRDRIGRDVRHPPAVIVYREDKEKKEEEVKGDASFNKVLGPAGRDREIGHKEPVLMDTKVKQSDSVSDNKDKGKFEVETGRASGYN